MASRRLSRQAARIWSGTFRCRPRYGSAVPPPSPSNLTVVYITDLSLYRSTAFRNRSRLTTPELMDAGTGRAGLECALPRAQASPLHGQIGQEMALDSTATAAHVTTPAGRVIGIPDGTRLVFGRGPDADLIISVGRGLSRRAGIITGLAGGALITNISSTHALYADGDGFRIRLPRVDQSGEPADDWLVQQGTALVGSRAMLDEGEPLRLVVAARAAGLADGDGRTASKAGSGDQTLLPLYLDPHTKLFLVALIWCRPWLIDAARSMPLPRAPEIARAALEATGAQHEIECFDADPAFRDRLSARVGEHLKVLRRKIIERGLARPDTRLSDEVVVGVLIENGIISSDDLDRFEEPAWCSRQEDLWWT